MKKNSFWNNIFRRNGMSDVTQLFVQNYGGSVVWPDTSSLDTYTDSYTGNGDVFTVLNKIIEPASKVPILHVDDQGEEMATSRTLDLLNAPAPFKGINEFIEEAIGQYLLYGNLYLNALRPEGGLNKGMPIRLEFLPAPYTAIIAGTRLEPVRGYAMTYLGSTLEFPIEDVLHWKEFNPDWDDNFGVYGMSRLKPIIKSVMASDSAYQSMVSAFKNQGAYGILTVLGEKNDTGGYDNKTVNKQQIAALKNQFKPGGEFAGDINRGKIAATNKSVEWINLGLSPVDLKILESLGVTRGVIADAYNVPNQLLSGSQDKTYNNYQEAARSLWTNAVQPNLDMLLNKLSMWLLPQFGETGHLVADYSTVDVLQKNKTELADWMIRAEAFTGDEIREALGYPALGTPEMQQVYVSMGKMPIDGMPLMDETEKRLKFDYRN